MKKENNIEIYPFTAFDLPLLRYQNINDKSINLIPVCPPALNIASNDFSYLDRRTVVYENNYRPDKYCFIAENKSFAEIEWAIEYSEELEDREIILYRNQLQDYEPLLKFARKKTVYTYSNKHPEDLRKISKLNTISDCKIIGVISAGGNNNKQEVCLSITSALRRNGFKAESLFITKEFSIIGFSVLDLDELFGVDYDSTLRTINSTITNKIKEEFLDFLVLEIPGDVARYNHSILNGSGLQTYIFSQAINIDTAICCVPFSGNSENYYLKIADHINRKFSIENIYFHMSNFAISKSISAATKKISGGDVDAELYIEYLRKIKMKLNDVDDLCTNEGADRIALDLNCN